MAQAGWYTDPSGRWQQRYWDGNVWTEHIIGPNGQTTESAVLQAQQQAQQQPHVVQQPVQQQPHVVQQPVQQQPAQQQPVQQASTAAPGDIRCDPAPLQQALAAEGVQPRGPGDMTPGGEPILVLTYGFEPETFEWWTPQGVLVAVARRQYPSDAHIEQHSTYLDEASKKMIKSRYLISDVAGTVLGSCTHLLEPFRARIVIDDPHGRRVASIRPDKAIQTRVASTCTSDQYGVLGAFTAESMRAHSIDYRDPHGMRLAQVVNIGKWDTKQALIEQYRRRPLQTLSQWIVSRASEALFPMTREPICSAVVFDAPVRTQPQALIALLAPLVMEQQLSLV